MTKEERKAICISIEQDLFFTMLRECRECKGDFIDLFFNRDREADERLVLSLAFEGIKAIINRAGIVELV